MHNPTVQTADAKVVGYAKAIGTPTGYKCIVFNASKCDIVVNGAERPGKCCEESFDWSNSAVYVFLIEKKGNFFFCSFGCI